MKLSRTWLAAASLAAAVSLLSCATLRAPTGGPGACLASGDADYLALGLSRGKTAIWEDGMRTDGGPGSYEWWYTDARFEDGTVIVTVFYTKDHFDVPGPAAPTAEIDIIFPDGTKLTRTASLNQGRVLESSGQQCDLRVGDCSLRYRDGRYEIRFADRDLEYAATMTSTLPMWRPETGYIYFGRGRKAYFAWFVAQPSAEIAATLKVSGRLRALKGLGYHDHNWGNAPMSRLINHWYWGRVRIGEYTAITSDIVAARRFGFARIPLFMIADGGRILEDGRSRLSVIREDTVRHPRTGKFIDNRLIFTDYSRDGTEYQVEYRRERDILVITRDSLPGGQRFLAWLACANPSYLRISGMVRLTVTRGLAVQRLEQEGLWEQMLFGSNRAATIGTQE
jgi:hypothetical protein